MALDAARGMLYLHTRAPAVYHRDLKSANLLVTQSWQVKVSVFSVHECVCIPLDVCVRCHFSLESWQPG